MLEWDRAGGVGVPVLGDIERKAFFRVFSGFENVALIVLSVFFAFEKIPFQVGIFLYFFKKGISSFKVFGNFTFYPSFFFLKCLIIC